MSRFELYQEMVGALPPADRGDDINLARGQVLEPVVLRLLTGLSVDELLDEPVGPVRTLPGQDPLEGLQPLGGLLRIEIGEGAEEGGQAGIDGSVHACILRRSQPHEMLFWMIYDVVFSIKCR
jgi:hypothetical protein